MSTAVRLDFTVFFNPEGVLWHCCDWSVVGGYCNNHHTHHLGQHRKPVSFAKDINPEQVFVN